MANHKTPLIRKPRVQGGTLYTFPSVTEDIGLNINERRNKVALSHYALLNLPKAETAYTSNENKFVNRFNLTNIPSVYNEFKDKGTKVDPSIVLASSLQNYVFNFETVLRNREIYNYSNPLTVSERVFWKWLKEVGAIRWEYDKEAKAFKESTEDGYNRVVHCIGEIKSGSNNADTFGVYNETYINVPTSYGSSTQFFKQVVDDNYLFGNVYEVSDSNVLEGNSSLKDKDVVSDIPNKPFADTTTDNENSKTLFSTSKTNDPHTHWYDKYSDKINVGGLKNIAYITDPYLSEEELNNPNSSLDDILYYTIEANDDFNETQNVQRKFKRSKLDGISLITNINEIRDIYTRNKSLLDVVENEGMYLDSTELTYDDMSISLSTKPEYDFNAILIYYSVYDNSGKNVLATNLFGVLFLDNPNNEITQKSATGSVLNFHIPTLHKIQSNNVAFGTSYSFRLNIKTFDVYDNTEAYIYDKTTSASLQEANFNDVVYSLNKSVELLGKSINTNNLIRSSYYQIQQDNTQIKSDLMNLKKQIKGVMEHKFGNIRFNNIEANLIKTNYVDISNGLKFVNGDKSLESVIDIDEEGLKLNSLFTKTVESVNNFKKIKYNKDNIIKSKYTESLETSTEALKKIFLNGLKIEEVEVGEGEEKSKELIISPSSSAFRKEEGGELYKLFSGLVVNKDEPSIVESSIDYVKLIPYIVRYIQIQLQITI